jgi:alkanesulfonate monooxygenase SsuD/methylene tetrahydromethanopterin reductase-like flavin-dependent oxidoreductase (luciferase family)
LCAGLAAAARIDHSEKHRSPTRNTPQPRAFRGTDAKEFPILSDHIHHLTRKLGRPDVHNTEPYAAESVHPLVTGTPRTALDKIGEILQKTGANYLLGIFSFGDLAPQHAMRSLELFRSEVMPKLKA